ncbi:MAG: beta-galactosidase, partial [Mycobacteriales bacterium]
MGGLARYAGGVTRRRFLGGAATAGALIAGGALPGWARGRPPAPHSARGGIPGSGTYPLPSALFGGELQYFRMSPSAIPARLELCRRAAYTVIQTYVPWNVHEFVPGQLDFTGRTHPILPNDHHLDPFDIEDPYGEYGTGGADGRLGVLCNTDLVSFLGQCRDAGFAVILRPGPFISDEWRNGGLPDWLLETAPPDMFEYGPDGTPLTPGAPMSAPPEVAAAAGGQSLFYFPSPSYASPYYLAAARGWMRSFAAFVRPW